MHRMQRTVVLWTWPGLGLVEDKVQQRTMWYAVRKMRVGVTCRG